MHPNAPWWRRALDWLRLRLHLGQRQLGEEVREAGERLEAEVAEAKERFLDIVDDLPLIGAILPVPAVRNQFYGHGAFMGAAPALLADPTWRRILAFLMPDVLEDVRAAVADGAGAERVIPMFENNPVACAFGATKGFARRRARAVETHANDLAGMEWDVYMDADLVDAWNDARDAGDDTTRLRVREELVARLVIAHASTADVVQEAAGICQYEDVRTTPKTRLGGVEVDAWLDLFGRALLLAEAPDLDEALARMRPYERVLEGEACLRYTFVHPLPAADVVEVWRRVSGQRHLGVVLEVKSLRSTPALVTDIVASLNARGVWVRAACSFKPEETAGVSEVGQVVAGEEKPGPREIRFFHFAADLQAACDAGRVPAGQGLLFNGASLLAATGDAEDPYRPLRDVVAALEVYRVRHAIDLGLYVQENDCDALAAATLSRLVDEHPETFGLGFAWGGLLDEAAIPHDGKDRRGLGAQGMLAWVSRGWRFTPDEEAPTDT